MIDPLDYREERPVMFTTTTPTCPSWCNGDHLTTASGEDGFHHDAEQWSLLPANQDHTGGDAYVFVNVAQFVPADGAPCPAIVEMTPDNGPIVRLTPGEASQLALALLVAAKTAHVNAAQPLDRGHTMAPSLDALAADLGPSDVGLVHRTIQAMHAGTVTVSTVDDALASADPRASLDQALREEANR